MVVEADIQSDSLGFYECRKNVIEFSLLQYILVALK